LVLGQQLAPGHAEPTDKVGGLLVPWASVRAVKPDRSANRNVCTAGFDRCAIAHRNLRPDNQAR
jgi:hypothetical protein